MRSAAVSLVALFVTRCSSMNAMSAVDVVNSSTDGTAQRSDASDARQPAGPDADSGSTTIVQVSVQPLVAHVVPGATAQFSALVTGVSDHAVSWSIQEGSSGGTVTQSGLYTAPTSAGTYHLVASAHADSHSTGAATIVVSTPGSCSSLASSGTWENIDPTGVTDTTSITIDPFDSAIVWLGTTHRGFFKSTDCGGTWNHVNTGMNGSFIDAGSNWSIAVDFVHRGTIFLVGAYGALGLWKTTNGGVDWTQVFPAHSAFADVADQDFVNNISMDPNDPLHLLVDEHGTCTGFDTSCEAESTDGGDSWVLTATPHSWGENGGVQILNATSWVWGGGTGSTGTYLTTDRGHTWQRVSDANANGEGSTRPLAPASDGAYYLSTLNGVLRSSDGLAWSLISHDLVVGIAIGTERIYATNQWSNVSIHTALISDPTHWTEIPAAPGFADGQGCPFLDYDNAHHVLYASCFASGVWRVVTP